MRNYIHMYVVITCKVLCTESLLCTQQKKLGEQHRNVIDNHYMLNIYNLSTYACIYFSILQVLRNIIYKYFPFYYIRIIYL